MLENPFIEWITLNTNQGIYRKQLIPDQEQSGRMFRKILNAHYVMLEKISFQKLNRSLILF